MTVLPLTYAGNLLWWKEFASGDCIIDIHENYVKQTLRNRCEILTPSGRASLTVQVAGCKGVSTPARDIRIDYSKRWQHRHCKALLSAYGKAPYYEHYCGLFLPLLTRRWEFLADLNLALAEAAAGIAAPERRLVFSERYIKPEEAGRDLRGAFSPRLAPAQSPTAPYCQVFSDRLPFEPNLSVLDLIFCEGPEARALLSDGGRPYKD